MKSLIIALSLLPTLSFASMYSCEGSGFTVEVTAKPLEMKINGNGFNNTMAKNVKLAANFETVIKGNTTAPSATVNLTVKDSFASPGEKLSAILQISSATQVKDYTGITCTKGNE